MMMKMRIIMMMFVFATFQPLALRLIAHLHRETNKLCTFGQINDDDDGHGHDDGHNNCHDFPTTTSLLMTLT